MSMIIRLGTGSSPATDPAHWLPLDINMTTPQWANLLSQVGFWGEYGLGSESGGGSGEVKIREGGSGKGGSDSGDDEGK
ncbi:hypothetical protein Tco_0045716 [Tanacetum coccineum]